MMHYHCFESLLWPFLSLKFTGFFIGSIVLPGLDFEYLSLKILAVLLFRDGLRGNPVLFLSPMILSWC